MPYDHHFGDSRNQINTQDMLLDPNKNSTDIIIRRPSVLYSASSAALIFDPRRSSWQAFRPSSTVSYPNLVIGSIADLSNAHECEETDLDVEYRRRNFSGFEPGNAALEAVPIPVIPNGTPRIPMNIPIRMTTMNRFGAHARNIAPKARIIKNILVLGCSYMCCMGCFAPLRTYFSFNSELKILAPLSLAILEICSALSCFYGAFIARKLTYKMTMVLCQIPFAFLLGAIVYTHYYTVLPAVVLLGLCRGPLLNAAIAYSINMAVEFAYFSYETKDKMVKRFISTFNTLASCGLTWGHLLTAGALNALEKGPSSISHNVTRQSSKISDNAHCGNGYCNPRDILQFPQFTWHKNISLINIADWKIIPLYTATIYIACIFCGILLVLFLLDKLKVQLCSQTSKQSSAWQLFSEIIQIVSHRRMRMILPMFIFLGLHEAFIICDVMKAYVLCITQPSTVGYVMFSYGLVNTFLNGFLCAAIRHIRRITILMAGLACQIGAMLIMCIWKPIDNDQPILFVISAAFSMTDSIWTTLSQTMVYNCFPEQWEAPFSVFFLLKAFGSSVGFALSPFGCLQYRIYFMVLSSALAVVPFAIQELKAQKSEWF